MGCAPCPAYMVEKPLEASGLQKKEGHVLLPKRYKTSDGLMDLVLACELSTNAERKNLARWARTRNIGSSKLDLFGTILSIRGNKASRGFCFCNQGVN